MRSIIRKMTKEETKLPAQGDSVKMESITPATAPVPPDPNHNTKFFAHSQAPLKTATQAPPIINSQANKAPFNPDFLSNNKVSGQLYF